MQPTTTDKPFALTDKQREELESEDSFLRGSQALDILNKAVKETGVVIPKDYVFKSYDKGVAQKAINAVFGLMGGVPKMLLWAEANQGDFYRMFGKQAVNDQAAQTGTAIQIVTNLPTTTHDNKVMNDQGFVTAIKVPAKKSVLEDDDDDGDA